MNKRIRIAVLPGDGVGPEVTSAAIRVLEATLELAGHEVEFEEALVGAAALRAVGSSLPDETVEICESADAVLLGAVGDPGFEPTGNDRPEKALLDLRQRFDLFANLRPVKARASLAKRTPFNPEAIANVELLFVRELTGGLYYGARQEATEDQTAFDTMTYEDSQIRRIAEMAFRLSIYRTGRVTSIDKANVLASMRQWRETVTDTAAAFPSVRLAHHLVDSFAMEMLLDPGRFDVILTPNMFGDILSDEAAALVGSLGVLPSASIGDGPFGLYEPVHGSAPAIAGQGIANPIGCILSAAMMLRHTLDLEYAADWIEEAVDGALSEGLVTLDLSQDPSTARTTREMTDGILRHLETQFLDRQIPMKVV